MFMHKMINMLKCFNIRKRITLPLGFFEELDWWRSYAAIFNGEADIIDTTANTFEIFTDACMTDWQESHPGTIILAVFHHVMMMI